MAIKNVGFVVFFLGLVARSIFWNVRNLVLSNDEIIHDQDLLLDPSPDLHRPRIKNARKRLLLTVPFYVYEELAWLNATYDRVPVKDWITSPRINKHSNDYWFAKASLDHPLRTMDPSKAKLFVVPILMNTFDSNELRRRICWNKMCNKKLLSYAGELLNHSPWFQNSSHLHIVTTSHYAHNKTLWRKPMSLRNALYEMHAISYEDHKSNSPARKSFPSYLVGTPCPTQKKKKYQVAMIASVKESFKDRQKICKWVNDKGKSNVTVSICGSGDQCPALAESEFGFHVRGDTYGSNRLMDTILSTSIPIFTQQKQYSIIPDWINWEKVSYFVPVHSEKSFFSGLNKILNDSQGNRERFEALMDNRMLFDWTTLIPFDTYMYMLQAHLYPETRHTNSPWSALILP